MAGYRGLTHLRAKRCRSPALTPSLRREPAEHIGWSQAISDHLPAKKRLLVECFRNTAFEIKHPSSKSRPVSATVFKTYLCFLHAR